MSQSENVIIFETRPETIVTTSQALSQDAEGFTNPLVAGQKFCGFAVKSRISVQDEPRVIVQYEGVTDLRVEGAHRGMLACPVYATGPRTFTVENQGRATEIGHILKVTEPNKATVKYFV